MWIIICGAGLLLSALILLISGKTKLPAACRCPGIGGLFQKAAYRLLFYFGKQGKPSADAINRLSLCLLLLNVFNMLAFSAAVYGRLHPAVSNGRIERGDYFSGEKELTVSEEEFGTFQVNVQPRRYTEEATRELARKLKRCLPEKMRGENPSLQEVSKNLILPRQVEGYPFEITWDSSDYERMDDSGRIRNPGAGELRLTAHFFYEEFQDSAQFSVQLVPEKKSAEEAARDAIESAIRESETRNPSGAYLQLPDSAGNIPLHWKEQTGEQSPKILGAGMLCCFAVCLLYDSRRRSAEQARNRQLTADYPQIVSKIVLYLGAGMSIRGIFYKLSQDDQRRLQEGGEKRYAYEEIRMLCNEMNSGVPEAKAYLHLGERCRLRQYTKLCALLTQNLRKGNSTILSALQREAEDAYEERKNIARRLGEEAGTKLLLPMIMMLVVTLVIIIVPAYQGFQM